AAARAPPDLPADLGRRFPGARHLARLALFRLALGGLGRRRGASGVPLHGALDFLARGAFPFLAVAFVPVVHAAPSWSAAGGGPKADPRRYPLRRLVRDRPRAAPTAAPRARRPCGADRQRSFAPRRFPS